MVLYFKTIAMATTNNSAKSANSNQPSNLQGHWQGGSNVLIFGCTQQEHDTKLTAALQKIQSAGVTLNKEKCKFSKDRLTFLDDEIDKHIYGPKQGVTMSKFGQSVIKPAPPSKIYEVQGSNTGKKSTTM